MKVVLVLLSALLVSCQPAVECGPGTLERNGICVPADDVVNEATCGEFTRLEGGQCVPELRPTVCDPASTEAETGPDGIVTCIGTGSGFACPDPEAGKQTICGQLFDLETGQPFSDPGAQCARCTAPSAMGPCSVGIRAFDAIEFGTNPAAAQPLVVGDTYIDDCGRYKLENITVPSGPFIGLGIDDAMQGPPGTTVPVGVATLKTPGIATKDFEAFVAPLATTTKWTMSGGPMIQGGFFVAIFRAMSTGQANQAGVTVTRGGQPIPNDDDYFVSTEATRATIDPAATATGANGTAIIQPASVAEGVTYSALQGPLPPECRWPTTAGVSLPGIVFVQIYRPIDASGMNCPL